jgi:gamma-glutamylcyclotransferase (GGCT)/AIG2-like uncharacterized protein YtfP
VETEVKAFMYGSLRPGEYNAGRFGDDGRLMIRDVTTPGGLWTANRAYPVAKFGKEYGEVIFGDILIFNTEGREWQRICHMEMGAGYVPVVVPVRTRLWRRPEVAVAWHYTGSVTGAIPVDGGDWIEWQAEQEADIPEDEEIDDFEDYDEEDENNE